MYFWKPVKGCFLINIVWKTHSFVLPHHYAKGDSNKGFVNKASGGGDFADVFNMLMPFIHKRVPLLSTKGSRTASNQTASACSHQASIKPVLDETYAKHVFSTKKHACQLLDSRIQPLPNNQLNIFTTFIAIHYVKSYTMFHTVYNADNHISHLLLKLLFIFLLITRCRNPSPIVRIHSV